ncbi:MAG: hypothetical protein L6Q83_05970 [Gammaproteobacteria bacterium]|nr:hypothetical protein [Gammaproteobacteria bacterium]
MTLLRWMRGRTRHGLRLRIAAAAVTALALATLAFASHVHAPDQATHGVEASCALCLHIERLGTTPEPSLAIVFAAGAGAPPSAVPHMRPGGAVVRAYRSRAPPA